MSFPVLSIMVAAPALAAGALLVIPERRLMALRLVALAGAVVPLALSLVVAALYDGTSGQLELVEVYPLVPTLGIDLRFGVDGWGVALSLLTGLIILAGVMASWRLTTRPREFFALLLILVAGVFGVFVVQDLFVFFLFYEIAVLPMYLLIAIWGSSHQVPGRGPFARVYAALKVGDKQYAAMKLTLMLLVGSAVLLVGIIAMYGAAGARTFDMAVLGSHPYERSFQEWVFPLIWIGFGSLAGVFPFHTWSPDGHASAPTAVSMLHAGVLMKLGAFGVMRVGMMMLPEGAHLWAPAVGTVAAVNVVYGALAAMAQKDLKYVIAYSSVSHMGVVMLGAATGTIEGWNGAVFQMFAHGVMTGLLFALVGIVYERAHTRHVPSMGGFGARMPATAAFFTLAALSSLGMPGTAGFVAELLVLIGAWRVHPLWAIAGIVGAFVTAVYVLGVARRIFWGALPTEHAAVAEARGSELGALLLLGTAIVVFGVWPRLVLDVVDATTSINLPALLRGP
jgi:NADH-quinone oxidoreductase subunit M